MDERRALSRDKGQSFLRAFKIIEHLSSSERPPTLAELSSATGLARPTVSRLCIVLEQEGLVVRELDSKRYGPGWRLWDLAKNVIGGAATRKQREVILRDLVGDVGETCNITVPNSTSMLYIDRVECNWPLRMQLPVGTHVPLHCTPSGKLYLASLSKRYRLGLLKKLELKRHTDRTITSIERLEQELKVVRKERIAFDRGEFIVDMNSVAAPVTNSRGRLCATVAIHGPASRFTVEKAVKSVQRLRTAAQDLQSLISDS